MKSQLVSACAVAIAFTLPVQAATVELIVNGGFEDVGTADGIQQLSGTDNWAVYQNLPGWKRVSGAGIEVEKGSPSGTIKAHGGTQKVELDSDRSRGGVTGSTNTKMTQDLILKAGTYVFSFFYSPRVNTIGTETNNIEYKLSDFFGSTIKGPTGQKRNGTCPDGKTAVGCWTEVVFDFDVTKKLAGNYTLSFAATGPAETLGGFIDDVSLKFTPAAVPVPAAGLMLFGALGGLAALRRRKSA